MLRKEIKIILVGFGNVYRKDDGLGITLLDSIPEDIHKLKIPEISIDLAEVIKDFDVVIFIDAAINGERFTFKKLSSNSSNSPLSHHMSCEELLIWTRVLYQTEPEAYLLSIKGYDFDFGKELSEEGKRNLEEASTYIRKFINEIM